MHPVIVVVRPSAGVWLVEGAGATQVFTKASEAERWARQAAQSAALGGRFVELRVMDLQGRLAGTIAFGMTLAMA
jgi:hypothetical protein